MLTIVFPVYAFVRLLITAAVLVFAITVFGYYCCSVYNSYSGCSIDFSSCSFGHCCCSIDFFVIVLVIFYVCCCSFSYCCFSFGCCCCSIRFCSCSVGYCCCYVATDFTELDIVVSVLAIAVIKNWLWLLQS